MSGPRAIEVRDGGFVSVERGPDGRDWTRLEVMTAIAPWRSPPS